MKVLYIEKNNPMIYSKSLILLFIGVFFFFLSHQAYSQTYNNAPPPITQKTTGTITFNGKIINSNIKDQLFALNNIVKANGYVINKRFIHNKKCLTINVTYMKNQMKVDKSKIHYLLLCSSINNPTFNKISINHKITFNARITSIQKISFTTSITSIKKIPTSDSFVLLK